MMTTSWQPQVRAVAEAVMRTRAVPGMVIAVARGDGPPEHLVVGEDGRGRPLAEDSLLPVASISKLAVALAVLRLAARGALGLDDPPPRPAASIAGDLGEHAGTELEPFSSPFWRSLALPWGSLVTTAAGALALARAFAGVPAGFLPPALLAEATRDQAAGLGGRMIFL